MRKIFTTNSYITALSSLMEVLSKREKDVFKRHIVVVPDRMTLTAERALCDAEGGSFDVAVTTWNRMAKGQMGGHLPKQGSIMLIRNILAEKKNELTSYKKSATTRGFASNLYDSISQLAVCQVTPDQLRQTGNPKDSDIALVYEEYLKRTEGQFLDVTGKMKLLKNYLENSDFLSDATVYVACFDSYTKQMEDIMDVIENKSLGLYVFETKAEYGLGEVEFYASSSPVFTAKAVTTRILESYREGIKYEETCIISSGRTDEIERLLTENGCPYNAPSSLLLSEHTLGKFLSTASALPLKGYRAGDVIRLAKNVLSGVSKEESDAFERYVKKYAVTYKLFLSPFALGEDKDSALIELAEKARKRINKIISIMQGKKICDALPDLIDYATEHYPKNLEETDEGRANPTDKAKMLATLGKSLLSFIDDKTYYEAFIDAMNATELVSRPRKGGAIEIGSEKDFRGRAFKRVYVLDFDGNNHPFVTSDTGLISDGDIEFLRKQGAEISPTTAEVNKRAEDEFFLLLSSAQKVTLFFSEKPGRAYEKIRSLANSEIKTSMEMERSSLERVTSGRDFMRFCPTMGYVIEQYLYARAREKEDKIPLYYEYAKRLVKKEIAEKYSVIKSPDFVPEAGALMLSNNTKVTQIETYYSCPLKHYFKYGLRISKPETAKIEPVDEKYVKIMKEKSPEESAQELLAQALSESIKGDKIDKRLTLVLLSESIELCKSILLQSTCGDFTPVATEYVFGFEKSKLKGLTVNVGERKINLRGQIDRIDKSEAGVRVIDYKTGNATFDLSDLKYGVKLQLLIYLTVLLQAGYNPLGAFYFSTLSEYSKEARVLEGLYVNDRESLSALDPDILDGKSKIIKVKSKKDERYVGNGETKNDILRLMDYAVKMVEQACEEITQGYIKAQPYVKNYDACAFCDYANACGGDGERRKPPSAVLKKENRNEMD